MTLLINLFIPLYSNNVIINSMFFFCCVASQGMSAAPKDKIHCLSMPYSDTWKCF